MKMQDYKIAISGAHSQGKTTLVNKLKESTILSSELKFSYRMNLTRDLNKILSINEAGDDVSQFLVMSRHLEFALTPGRWVLDRCALDGLCYSEYFYDKGRVDNVIKEAIEKIYERCLPYYNRVIYITPELPLVEDGQRSVNKDFFEHVVKLFDFYTKHFSISNKITLVSGTVEERTKKVIDIIKEDFKDEL